MPTPVGILKKIQILDTDIMGKKTQYLALMGIPSPPLTTKDHHLSHLTCNCDTDILVTLMCIDVSHTILVTNLHQKLEIYNLRSEIIPLLPQNTSYKHIPKTPSKIFPHLKQQFQNTLFEHQCKLGYDESS